MTAAWRLLLDEPSVYDGLLQRLLLDAEDDELGRFDRRDADLADQPAVVDVVLGHGRAVAVDEERLLLRQALQRAAAPDRSAGSC